MTDLTDLLARIEAAEGPDRELDRAIMGQFYKWGWRKLGVQESGPKGWRPIRSYCWVDPKSKKWLTTAKQGFEFTTSLDASLALVERVIGDEAYGPHAVDLLEQAIQDMCVGGWKPNQPLGPQLARWVVAALLKHLIAQQSAPQPQGQVPGLNNND